MNQNHAVSPKTSLNNLLEKYASRFRPELGCLNTSTAKLFIDPQIKPQFLNLILYHIYLEKRSKKNQCLQALNILTPVTSSEWAALIVPILKTDGILRLCGDYKVTVNQALQQNLYPLTRVVDLFGALAGGIVFSKLDLSHAYQQIWLHENSKNLWPFLLSKDCFSTRDYLSELKQHLHYFKEPWKRSSETCHTFVFTSE